MKNMTYNPDLFWQRIKELLAMKNMTQVEFCRIMDFKLQSFKNKKLQKTYPSIVDCIRIARFFGVSVEWLVTGAN
jgi:DNA-binding XRE family transcriptional regulator